MQWHGWPITWDPQTTSLMCSLASTGCECQRIEYKIAVLTYKLMQGSVPHYSGPLLASRISPVDGHCAQPALVACWYHPIKLSTVGNNRSRVFSGLLEHPARKDYINTISEDFLSTSENLAFPAYLIQWSHHLIWQLSNYILCVGRSPVSAPALYGYG